MKTMERKKSQLIKYKMVNYHVKEGVDKNEEEVVEEEEEVEKEEEEEVEKEEELLQEADNDEQQTKNMKVK